MCKKFARFILIAFAILVSSKVVFSQTDFWEPVSLPPDGNSAIAVANNGDLWIGGWSIYLSTNNGNKWVKKGSMPYPIRNIAINPVNGSVFVYASSDFPGVLSRSINNGEKWEVISIGYTVYGINDIFITPSGGIYLATDSGVHYSSDDGDTWIKKSNGLPNPGTLGDLISCIVQGVDGTLYAGIRGNGVYRSTNGGDEWLPSSNYTNSVNSLTISGDGSIFATSGGSSIFATSGGVFKSIDRGITWNPVNTGLPLSNGSHEVIEITYNPITEHIFISQLNYGVFRSTNLGTNWRTRNDGLSDINNKLAVYRTFAVNSTTGMMFCLDGAHLYRSTGAVGIDDDEPGNGGDGPENGFWERTGGPPYGSYEIAVASNGDIWASNWTINFGSEIYLSTDNGNTWVQKYNGGFEEGSIRTIVIHPTNGYVFFGTNGYGLFRSTDRGENWKNVTGYRGVWSILFTPSGGMYLGGGGSEGIYYSSDNGDTWIAKSNGLPDNTVKSLVLGADGTLYSGMNWNGVYRSTNGGDNWLPPSNYTDVDSRGLIIPNNGLMFATAGEAGILKSTDKGISWNQVNTGFTVDKDANQIIYNPITREIFVNDAVYFSGYNFWVYRSTDLGASWELKNNGFPNLVYVCQFAFNPTTGQMYAATRDGVYRFTNHVMSTKEPTDVTNDGSDLLFQSNPNPVRSGYDASIRYRINTAGQTSLIVYDILGREITKLVNEYKSAGVYSVNFNTRNLSSGVYFYKLRATGYEGIKKMLIIR